MDYSEARVLIVDDTSRIRYGMRALLGSYGFSNSNIFEAEDGSIGLKAYHDCHPDIVITDTIMPVMNGPEMMKSLREEGYSGPIIQMSGLKQDIRHLQFNERFVPKGNFSALKSALEELLTPKSVRKPKILVVEDSDDIREGMSDLLNFHGYDVDAAADVDLALAKVSNSRVQYSLVISDTQMPRHTGGAVEDTAGPFLLSQLRQRFNYHGGFISVSGRGINESKLDYAGHNVDAFLEKPYKNSDMIVAVKAVIERRGGQTNKSAPRTNTAGAQSMPEIL